MLRRLVGALLLAHAAVGCSSDEPSDGVPPNSPAPPAGCEADALPLYVDADGDGSTVGDVVGYRCPGEAAGEGYGFSVPGIGGADCDDSDPGVQSGWNYYTDADGDGFGVPDVEHRYACRDTQLPGFAPNPNDCDDSDPERHLESLPDQDGDGYGSGDVYTCASSTDEGYARLGDDCDDDDPDRHPSAEEAALDGLDSDCDGSDFPLLLACEEPPVPEGEVPLTEGCAGPDLFIAAVNGCSDCAGGRFWVVVANGGTEPAAAELVIEPLTETFPFDPYVATVVPEIEPGSLSAVVTEILPVPGALVRVRVAGGEEDCDVANEAAELLVGIVDCL